MFTGIIEEVGAIAKRGGAELTVLAQKVLEDVALGDSIAIDGACMTVVEFTDESFVVQVSPESFESTTLGNLKAGDAVNLERAMALGDRFGGHLVQGHVDGVGRIEGVEKQGEFTMCTFWAPPEVAPYLIPKGSVTIDGISLTVVNPSVDTFAVAVIPTTMQETKLQSKSVGDPVNMEADVFGKHIYHYLKQGATQPGSITREFLSKHGFA
ncbi:MAG: riboflavin synthase [Candidatus Hydrogenedentota bacterium]